MLAGNEPKLCYHDASPKANYHFAPLLRLSKSIAAIVLSLSHSLGRAPPGPDQSQAELPGGNEHWDPQSQSNHPPCYSIHTHPRRPHIFRGCRCQPESGVPGDLLVRESKGIDLTPHLDREEAIMITGSCCAFVSTALTPAATRRCCVHSSCLRMPIL